MEGVRLMNRIDSKYAFNINQLSEVLDLLRPNYKVLEINNERALTYDTVYYDTDQYALYHHHHRGAVNRYKIRHRTYTNSGEGFLEVKFKNNRGRTHKDRINCQNSPLTFDHATTQFIRKKSPYDPQSLKPVILVSYKRITLVGMHHPERITLDLNLTFSAQGRSSTMHHLVIAEIKQQQRMKTPAMAAWHQLRIKQGGMSKYCLGMMVLYPFLKNNNFKQKRYILENL